MTPFTFYQGIDPVRKHPVISGFTLTALQESEPAIVYETLKDINNARASQYYL